MIGSFLLFDAFFILLLAIMVFVTELFTKSLLNMFIEIFISLIVLMFVGSITLVEQNNLSEFMVINIFFIFAMIFFILALKGFKKTDDYSSEIKFSNLKFFLFTFIFVITFSIILVNFYKISFDGRNINQLYNNLNSKQELLIKDKFNENSEGVIKNNEIKTNENYAENISLLNQNKIFQKLTHLIMFYVCLVVMLFFFNTRRDTSNEW